MLKSYLKKIFKIANQGDAREESYCLASLAVYDYVRKLVTWRLADVYDNQFRACFFCIKLLVTPVVCQVAGFMIYFFEQNRSSRLL